MEDFFDSAYGFGGGEFKYPVSGCTHREATREGGMALSAYRFHEAKLPSLLPLYYHISVVSLLLDLINFFADSN